MMKLLLLVVGALCVCQGRALLTHQHFFSILTEGFHLFDQFVQAHQTPNDVGGSTVSIPTQVPGYSCTGDVVKHFFECTIDDVIRSSEVDKAKRMIEKDPYLRSYLTRPHPNHPNERPRTLLSEDNPYFGAGVGLPCPTGRCAHDSLDTWSKADANYLFRLHYVSTGVTNNGAPLRILKRLLLAKLLLENWSEWTELS